MSWFNLHGPADSLFDSPQEDEMMKSLNFAVFLINQRLVPLGLYLEVEVQQKMVNLARSNYALLRREVEEATDWSYLRENTDSEPLIIGGHGYFAIETMTGLCCGRRAFRKIYPPLIVLLTSSIIIQIYLK